MDQASGWAELTHVHPAPYYLQNIYAYSMENIMARHQNFPAVKKRGHGRSILKHATKSRGKDFQLPRAITDRSLNIADMSIDESNISQLTMDQLSQIERKVEDALRSTKARKGKALLEERDLIKRISEKEKKQEGGMYGAGCQQSDEQVDVTLRLGFGIGYDIGCSHGHQKPINLNMP